MPILEKKRKVNERRGKGGMGDVSQVDPPKKREKAKNLREVEGVPFG